MAIPIDKFHQICKMTKIQVTRDVHKHLPSEPGLYVAFAPTGEILYVGKAKSLKRRWDRHHRLQDLLNLSPVVLAWQTFSSTDGLKELESEWIKDLKPQLNWRRNPAPVESRCINITNTRGWVEA